MRPVILFYSFTGNNRRLAETLSARIGCPAIEVVERRPRTMWRILMDMLFRRKPPIEPVDLPGYRDHVLVVTPLWNRWIAHPMRSALKALGPELGSYSIVTFSGGERSGQVDFVDLQLMDLVGVPPANHWAMYVDDLVPADIKGTIEVSSYRVSSDELEAYPQVAEIIARFTREPAAAA